MIVLKTCVVAAFRALLIGWAGLGALLCASYPLWLAGGLCRDLSAVAGLVCCLAAGFATAALTASEGER